MREISENISGVFDIASGNWIVGCVYLTKQVWNTGYDHSMLDALALVLISFEFWLKIFFLVGMVGEIKN